MPETMLDGRDVMVSVAVRMRKLAARSIRLAAVSLLFAGLAGGVIPVTASAAGTADRTLATFSVSGGLDDVAATSATNVVRPGKSGGCHVCELPLSLPVLSAS
jgi:hypothetical protein